MSKAVNKAWHVLQLIAAGFITAIITLSLATAFGGASRDLANRVDRNAEIASMAAANSVRNALENRYVSACSLYTPPFPERTVEDMVRCFEEAELMPEGAETGADVAEWLEFNLEENR